MKKFILSIIFGIGVMFSFNSCVTSAYACETDDIDVNVVIRYGTPYYYEGSLLYYVYDGWYYYPYVVNNRYYYHRYSKPLPYHMHHFSNRPVRHHMSSTYRIQTHHRKPYNGGRIGSGHFSRPNGGAMHHRFNGGMNNRQIHGRFGGRR